MKLSALIIVLAGTCFSATASAANWSDTYIGWRYGSTYAEPFNSQDISKNILNLQHVSGYKYGTNFFNVDLLISDQKDPGGAGQSAGAQEAYVVYRHTLSLSAVSGAPIKYDGYLRDIGITAGFDWNTKKDAGYNSKKQMMVVGPTLMLDVPGFLNVSVLEFFESNAPYNEFSGTGVARYHYDPHPALSLAWGIPIGGLPLSFEGFGLWIASKGKNEFGDPTVAETNIDAEVMLDVGKATGGSPNIFKVGLEYQYWQNKFGNDTAIAGKGAFAHTPMIRAEYHF
jgi:nucleoside-specific outer membrane channel protein Tsx